MTLLKSHILMNDYHKRTVEKYHKHDEVSAWMDKEVKKDPDVSALDLAVNCTKDLNLWESSSKIPVAILMIAEEFVSVEEK